MNAHHAAREPLLSPEVPYVAPPGGGRGRVRSLGEGDCGERLAHWDRGLYARLGSGLVGGGLDRLLRWARAWASALSGVLPPGVQTRDLVQPGEDDYFLSLCATPDGRPLAAWSRGSRPLEIVLGCREFAPHTRLGRAGSGLGLRVAGRVYEHDPALLRAACALHLRISRHAYTAALLVASGWEGRDYEARAQDGVTFLAAVAAGAGLAVPARRFLVASAADFVRQLGWLHPAPRPVHDRSATERLAALAALGR